MTRVTIIWFVGAAVVGAAAGVLHVLRTDLGGSHTGTPITVGAWGLTALAALMLYHGIMVAAREQDEAAPARSAPVLPAQPSPGPPAYGPAHADVDAQLEMVDDAEAYTFRRKRR